MTVDELLTRQFVPFGDALKLRAEQRAEHAAVSDPNENLTWQEFDKRVDRIATRLQEQGVTKGSRIAIVGYNTVGYVLVYCAAVRIGAVAALLTTSAPAAAIEAMLRDCGPTHLFLDHAAQTKLNELDLPDEVCTVAHDNSSAAQTLNEWMAPDGARPMPVPILPDDPFNIIYSSGTTGTPKGVVQSHQMRFGHMRRSVAFEYDHDAVTLLSTPLYSNTTLVTLIPALTGGGRVILMPKFDVQGFLELAVSEKVTHAVLVPVQYQRIMSFPDFDRFDLSRFRFKSCTSAPFSAALKADIVRRWPGRLVEIYGMTEGGGTCLLEANESPDKLHTVGQPAPGHDIRLVDERGIEVGKNEVGEVVGRSPMMMSGYYNQKEKTREAEWYDNKGRRFIRHGDLGRFDDEGFLILVGRAKDIIISGGFNIYPSDLEEELQREPQIDDAAVVGMPSERWGETPVAFVVLKDSNIDPDTILPAVNARLGATQRLSAIHVVDKLPRNALGKVLKTELRKRCSIFEPSSG